MSEHPSAKLPQARTNQLVVQEIDKETLIYDLDTKQAFALNPASAFIWRHCDGEMSYEELGNLSKKHLKTKFDADFINIALNDFKKSNLLSDESNKSFTTKRISRRRLLKTYGASVVALPVVLSLVAPTAVAAQSVNCLGAGRSCQGNALPCCSGLACVLDPASDGIFICTAVPCAPQNSPCLPNGPGTPCCPGLSCIANQNTEGFICAPSCLPQNSSCSPTGTPCCPGSSCISPPGQDGFFCASTA